MRRSSRAQELADWLEHQIRSGAWAINSQIPTESQLAELHGVGRSTIREATRSLANIGMLESLVGRGTFVRSRTPVDSVLTSYLIGQPVDDVLGLRRALEVEAAGLAALRHTAEDIEALRHALDLGHRVFDGDDSSSSPGEFHVDLFTAAHNPLMIELYQAVLATVRQAVASHKLRPAPSDERLADHKIILAAIERGDVEASRQAAALHADRDFSPPT